MTIVEVPIDPFQDYDSRINGITGFRTPNGLQFDSRPGTNECEGCAFEHSTSHDGCVCEDLPPCAYTNIIWVEVVDLSVDSYEKLDF